MSNQSKKIDFVLIINIALRLFVVCTIIAAVVAGVNALTKDRIAKNEQQVINQTIREAFPEGESKITQIKNISFKDTSVNAVYKIAENEDLEGYSVICAPKGFGGEIKMMVAFDSSKSIKAVRIMNHSETPGIGDKIVNPEYASFTEQFNGKNNELKFGDGIDKISGSTKSSNAVLNGINDAISVVSALD